MAFALMAVHRHCVARGEIFAEVMGTGTLEARLKSTISPNISGRIEKIFRGSGRPGEGRRAAGETL